MLSPDEIDEIITQLKGCRGKASCGLPEQNVRHMCAMTRELFMAEPMLLDLKAPINICGMIIAHFCLTSIEYFCTGDIHGQFNDLLDLFEKCGDPSSGKPYLFLGYFNNSNHDYCNTKCICV